VPPFGRHHLRGSKINRKDRWAADRKLAWAHLRDVPTRALAPIVRQNFLFSSEMTPGLKLGLTGRVSPCCGAKCVAGCGVTV
jgi:hypothetical protein